MKLKFTFKNGTDRVLPTHASLDGFMEEYAVITNGTFGVKGRYMTKFGDFIEVYNVFMRYEEILSIEEYVD